MPPTPSLSLSPTSTPHVGPPSGWACGCPRPRTAAALRIGTAQNLWIAGGYLRCLTAHGCSAGQADADERAVAQRTGSVSPARVTETPYSFDSRRDATSMSYFPDRKKTML